MASGGSSTQNGGQQVSIYPYQALSSTLGNELLYGVLVPGVSNVAVTITAGAGGNVNFNILPGAQMVFQRQSSDLSQFFLGKIVTTTTATISFLRTALWGTNPTFTGSKTLYLVADWTYNPASPSTIYAQFTLENDTTINTIKANDGTSNNQLILATILNNQYYVGYVAGLPGTYTNGAVGSTSLGFYHIAYDSQNQRSPLTRLYNANQDFIVDFDAGGRGVYVENGQLLVNGVILNYAPTFDGTGGLGTYPTRTLSSPNTGIIRPPVGLTAIINPSTNVATSIVGSENSYYQIDFLRLKSDDVTHLTAVAWESFLRPAGSLDFDQYSNMTQANLLAYFSALTPPYNQFQLSGEGVTLLVSVRMRGTQGSWVPIPTTDGPTNILWPESTIGFKESAIHSLGMAPSHKRFKLPVWQSSDIGL